VPAAPGRFRQHRPWFPGPLGQYGAWFPGIQLSRDFERVKVPGNPMKSRFVLLSFGGQILSITICARRQPNHVKNLLVGLNNPPGDPRVARCRFFRSDFYPPISGFCPLTGISARGYHTLLPAIQLISGGEIANYSGCLFRGGHPQYFKQGTHSYIGFFSGRRRPCFSKKRQGCACGMHKPGGVLKKKWSSSTSKGPYISRIWVNQAKLS
jgi:hypothetical protein